MTVYLEVHDKNPPAGGLDVYAPFIAKFNPTHRDLSELLVPWFGDVPYDNVAPHTIADSTDTLYQSYSDNGATIRVLPQLPQPNIAASLGSKLTRFVRA